MVTYLTQVNKSTIQRPPIQHISYYALTRDAPESETELFYELLTFIIKKVLKSDLTLIGGNFKARIKRKVSSVESAISQLGFENRCSRGSRLFPLVMTNGSVCHDRVPAMQPRGVQDVVKRRARLITSLRPTVGNR